MKKNVPNSTTLNCPAPTSKEISDWENYDYFFGSDSYNDNRSSPSHPPINYSADLYNFYQATIDGNGTTSNVILKDIQNLFNDLGYSNIDNIENKILKTMNQGSIKSVANENIANLLELLNDYMSEDVYINNIIVHENSSLSKQTLSNDSAIHLNARVNFLAARTNLFNAFAALGGETPGANASPVAISKISIANKPLSSINLKNLDTIITDITNINSGIGSSYTDALEGYITQASTYLGFNFTSQKIESIDNNFILENNDSKKHDILNQQIIDMSNLVSNIDVYKREGSPKTAKNPYIVNMETSYAIVYNDFIAIDKANISSVKIANNDIYDSVITELTNIQNIPYSFNASFEGAITHVLTLYLGYDTPSSTIQSNIITTIAKNLIEAETKKDKYFTQYNSDVSNLITNIKSYHTKPSPTVDAKINQYITTVKNDFIFFEKGF